MIEGKDEVNLCQDCPEPEPKPVYEGIKWIVNSRVDKYEGDWTAEEIAAGAAGDPYEVVEILGNLLVNVGIDRIEDQLIGATTSPYNNTNCRLGVGNSATAAAATQTDLQAAAGAANRQFKLMDATYPSRSGETLTFKATYVSGEAEFVWNEWGIDRGSSNGTTVVAPLLNRKVASMGTKGAGVTWTLTVTITLS